MKKLITICLILCVCVLSANAVPTIVTYVDTPEQDVLMVPSNVDELGQGFPWGEMIESSAINTNLTACTGAPYDNPAIPNALVSITNCTLAAWSDLWYVRDPETTLTNYDGVVNGQFAFKIDYIGMNVPLVYESITANAIFEVGETWSFIIQDYSNTLQSGQLMLLPSAFGSIGVGNGSMGDIVSSGSIIAIPEPATICMLGLGVLGLLKKRRA
jgi:hypothetical protein